jgi:hypothetical protein
METLDSQQEQFQETLRDIMRDQRNRYGYIQQFYEAHGEERGLGYLKELIPSVKDTAYIDTAALGDIGASEEFLQITETYNGLIDRLVDPEDKGLSMRKLLKISEILNNQFNSLEDKLKEEEKI